MKALHVWRLSGVLLVLAALAGCAERTVTVTGKLVLPAGMKLAETDGVTVGFIPEDTNKKNVIAVYSHSDSTFTAKEVSPGKNKVTINISPYPGGKDFEQRKDSFEALNKKYSNPETKLIYDVGKEAQQSITIDAGKGTVTKG